MLWLPSKQHTPATYLCTVYVPYMSLICPLYVPDMSLICPLYVPYMSLICRQQRSSRLGTCAQMPRKLRSEEDSGLKIVDCRAAMRRAAIAMPACANLPLKNLPQAPSALLMEPLSSSLHDGACGKFFNGKFAQTGIAIAARRMAARQ